MNLVFVSSEIWVKVDAVVVKWSCFLKSNSGKSALVARGPSCLYLSTANYASLHFARIDTYTIFICRLCVAYYLSGLFQLIKISPWVGSCYCLVLYKLMSFLE